MIKVAVVSKSQSSGIAAAKEIEYGRRESQIVPFCYQPHYHSNGKVHITYTQIWVGRESLP
jgi:hypothetical protein